MARRRALLTDSQRDIFPTPTTELEPGRPRQRVYEEKSRVRELLPELEGDADVLLDGGHDDLYAELVEALLTERGIEILADRESDEVEALRSALCSE